MNLGLITWIALWKVPFLTGYIFTSWMLRVTCWKDLAAHGPAASHSPSSHPLEEQVQTQAFFTQRGKDIMTPQLHMWLHKSFQERTFPDLSSHLKETRSSDSPSAVDSTWKFPAQGFVLRLCKSGSAPTNSVHCPGGQVFSRSHHSLLHHAPAKSFALPCCKWSSRGKSPWTGRFVVFKPRKHLSGLPTMENQ